VIHACHGGRTTRSRAADLGGAPGLALAIQSRLVLAPVTEVPQEAALALHDEMVASRSSDEIGLRYLRAVQRNPSVALYNLHGFANEKGTTS
jgi:hypothetical protein